MLSDEEKILDDINFCLEGEYITREHYEAIQGLLNLYKQEKKTNDIDLTIVYMNGFYDGEKKVKDKIKAKIEELDIEIQCCEYADDDTEEYKKDIEKEKRRLLRDKKVLQSLLEKE